MEVGDSSWKRGSNISLGGRMYFLRLAGCGRDGRSVLLWKYWTRQDLKVQGSYGQLRRCQDQCLSLAPGNGCCYRRRQFWTVLQWSDGEGNGTPLQYSCLENPMEGGAWQAAVHGIAKSRVGLSNFTFTPDQISSSVVSDSLRPHESQLARPSCPSPTPGVHSDSCPSSQ